MGTGRTSRRFALSLTAALACGGGAVSAQDAPPASLDGDLVELASRDVAESVDVWVLFAEQPARRAAEEIRPGYERLIDAARARGLAALDRIDPLLPPRAERARMQVGKIMERERALLTDDEVGTLRSARDETLRLSVEMRRRILETARPLCETQQAPVARWIEAQPGGRVETRTVVLDALIARVPSTSLVELARAFPSVARIARAKIRTADLDTSVPTIGAGSWTANGYAGGGGVSVAVVDTGVDASHPAFTTSSGGAVVSAQTVQLGIAALYGGTSFNDNASSTDDLVGHGTHCAGIVASNDSTYTGVAPGTSLLNAKCFFRTSSGGGSAFDADIVSGMDWAITNGANVLSCSFGGGGTSDGTDPLTIFFDAVVEVSGVSIAVAAGNSGSSAGTVSLPGDAFNAITVGAFNHNASTTLSDDSLASFSGRGPTSDNRRKPDLSAPGYAINSCYAAWEGGNPDFVQLSGTSMATPHVGGALGLLLSSNSAWQPESLKALLANSCRNSGAVSGVPDSNWGCGGLDLGQAYTDRTLTTTGTFTTTGARAHYYKLGSLASGGRTTIAWNRVASYWNVTPSSGPGSAKALVDLDLYLYDGATGSQAAASASGVDSLEQAAAPSAITGAVVKVHRFSGFPSGQSSVGYALASVNAATLATPPALVVESTSASADVAGGTDFTFTATLRNDGDLRAVSPTVTLALPVGLSFATGSTASQTIASIDPATSGGGTANVTWTVHAGTTSGAFTMSVAASTTAFGDTFTSATATRSVTVDAVAPAANAGADVSLLATSAAGRTISLDASASSDASTSVGHALNFAWDTDGDGSFTDTPGSATGASPSVGFAIGSRTVTLRVTDYVGNVGTDTLVVEVRDNAPVANAGIDRTVNEGASVAFDGTGSSDIEGAIASWSWNFGDGTALATTASPSHTYRDEGVYTVGLTVTDSAGHSATDTAVVTVANVAPTANAGTALAGNEGSAVILSGSATDPGTDVLAYAWNFGDGRTGSGATTAHVYADEGVYTATLTVDDGDGGVGVSSVQVTIANVAPTANAGSAITIDEGGTANFTGGATDPGASDVLTFAWDFGDGAVTTGRTPSHVYGQDGTYTATLSVNDGDGGTGTSTVGVTVRNVAPVASAGSPVSADEGAAVAFSGSATDAGALDTLTFSWDFGDGAIATGATASHAYRQDGVYTATLTATDEKGASSTSTRRVDVANVAPEIELATSMTVDIGADLELPLAPTDASSEDAAALAVTWRIESAPAGDLLASGADLDVTWLADRRTDATLVVNVADDHVAIERRVDLHTVTPPLGDTIAAVLGSDLDRTLEHRVLVDVLAARKLAVTPGKMLAASKKLAAAKTLLAKSGVVAGTVVARLTALVEDLAAGTALRAESALSMPPTPGTLDDLLAAAPRLAFDAKPTTRLLNSLVALRFAERAGSKRKIAAAQKKASAAASSLPAGPERDWFVLSLAAL